MKRQFIRDSIQHKLHAEINVVPYIDVMLVLLVIFMITAPIIQQGVTVDLPRTPLNKTAQAPNANDFPIVVEVDRHGVFSLQEIPDVTTNNVKSMAQTIYGLYQQNPDRQIFLHGDRLAPYGQMVTLFVSLKNLGFKQVQLMTQPEPN